MSKDHKDPVRFPKIQERLEGELKRNFSSTLKTITTQITKVLNDHKGTNR